MLDAALCGSANRLLASLTQRNPPAIVVGCHSRPGRVPLSRRGRGADCGRCGRSGWRLQVRVREVDGRDVETAAEVQGGRVECRATGRWPPTRGRAGCRRGGSESSGRDDAGYPPRSFGRTGGRPKRGCRVDRGRASLVRGGRWAASRAAPARGQWALVGGWLDSRVGG